MYVGYPEQKRKEMQEQELNEIQICSSALVQLV